MAELVSLDVAKRRARITECFEDDDLRDLLVQAQAVILRYLEDETDEDWTATLAAWTDETVPSDVQLAIVLQFKALDAARGDNLDADKVLDVDGLAMGVKGILRRLRKPVIA